MAKGNKYFKLIDAIDTQMTLNVAKKQNGFVKYGHITLQPGARYELTDDVIFKESLKGARVKKAYSKELEEVLKKHNIPYEEIYCKTCGGRTKKLSYAIVEVVE